MKNGIKNTEQNPNPEWLMGGNPRAIEAQELAGQSQLTAAREIMQMPREVGSRRDDGKFEYPKIGITVVKESDGDPLFYDVILPAGWRIVQTDHSMWSDLVDEQGKVRANIFYKAAFYDRKAFTRIN